MRRFVLVVLGVLLPGALHAQAPFEPGVEWRLRRDRQGIQVYTRPVADSPYDAVMSRMVLQDVRLSALVALIQDAEACPDWADKCAASHVHETISEVEALIYTVNDLPFPVQDRDILAHVVWQQDPDSLEVTMDSRATVDILPPQQGSLRLTDARVTWRFRPLAAGGVEVINEAHVDPGSALPGWVTNMLLVDTPYETLRALSGAVRQPKYADAEFDFVTEPGD